MSIYNVKIGIIGGSGLDDPEKQLLESQSITKKENAKNDFGVPSSDLYNGTINGVNVILLSRHGQGHKVSPSNVNYRANIEALRLAGCTHILASTACGSLVESITRGQLVIPDSFIDRTVKRNTTFYDGTSKNYPGVCHVPMEPCFDPTTSRILYDIGEELGYKIKNGGTVVSIEGPRFSSKAECNALRIWGGELVNMTTCPEVCLAKEAGLLYAAVAMATDYDCWRGRDDQVHAADVIEVFKQNIVKIRELLSKAVHVIKQKNWDKEIDALQELLRSSNISKS